MMRLDPIGFWSYARQDDEAFAGKLSALRAILAAELQSQYGKDPIKIFQDVAAIAPGSEWETEINNAIDHATFFIPLITPAFIQSEWCLREVELFMAREAAINRAHPELGGRRRVFPIRYIPIDGVDAHDEKLLSALKRLQWVDFSNFRYSDPNAEPVRRSLGELANSMCAVLSLKVKPQPSAEELAVQDEVQRAEAERFDAQRLQPDTDWRTGERSAPPTPASPGKKPQPKPDAMAARVETPGEAEGSAAAGSPPASGAPHAFLPALAYSFRHYADGYGRPGKFEYWALSGPYLANGLLAILSTHVFSSLILLFLLIYLAALLPATVLQARRLHDVGMSGWFALSSLIPGIGLIPIIAIGLIPGDDGPNKYGPPPTAG